MQGHFKVITLCGSTRLKDGAIQESGTAIAAILPPLPLFSKDRARSEKKARVIRRLKDFFDRFFDISGGSIHPYFDK